MDDPTLRNQLHYAVETRLSGLQGDPWLVQRVLAQAKSEPKRKRKRSVGFVIVLILLLAVTTAFAAISLRSFFEKAIEQESQSGEISHWSASEKAAFVNRMVEAGLLPETEQTKELQSRTLSEEQQDALAMSIITDFYPARDSFVTAMDIIAKEYGAYEQWPLELRAWYSETLEKYGHKQAKGVRNVLPQEGEWTQEEALRFAADCLTEVLRLSPEEIAALRCTSYFQEDEESALRVWYFNFFANDSDELLYYVYVSSDGTLLDCGYGDQELSSTDAAALNEEFYELLRYHADDFFTVNGLASFARELAPKLRKAIADGLEIEKWPAYFAQIPYAFPDASAISQEEACRIGSQAILTQYGKDAAWLKQNYVYTLSYRAYANADEWRLAYRIPPQSKTDAYADFYAGKIPFCIVVRIDPFTSQVLDIQEQNDINAFWYGE